jgi:cytoskeletal protein RodZ
MLSIGQRLSRARTERNLTIEDVAFHTHIPAGRVRDMENDDLSRFANLTYARGFLKIYSRFLDLDISDYLDQFSTAEMADASGHEYVQMANATQNLPAAVITDYGRARGPGLYILLLLAAAGAGTVWWYNRSEPVDESPLADPKPAVTSTESPAVPLPPTPAAPLTVPAKENEESESSQNDGPPAAPTPTVALPRPPDPAAKPPKAAVVEEDEEPPPDKSQKPRTPD